MRRIRNITDEPLNVPLLGVTIQPGDVANVPDTLHYVDFSEVLFEVENGDDKQSSRPVSVMATDKASADEGTK